MDYSAGAQGGGGGGWSSPPQLNGSFWRGQDGQVWVSGINGVNSAGAWDDNSMSYWENKGFAQIVDPYASQQVAGANTSTPNYPSAPSGGRGGTPAPVLNSAAVANTQKSIDEIPGLLQAALAAEKTKYDNTVRDFDTQQAQQQKTYDTSTVTNQQNYDRNYMDSIRAGIKGLGGLFQILRGTGAGGGTAEGLARDTVSGVTANDIRTGADTRDENQTALDTSLSSFLTGLDRKRSENKDTFRNNQNAIRRDSNTNLQRLYSDMAGLYSDAGQNNNATSWLNKAGNLTPQIARDSRTQVSKYDTAPIEVKAPELTAFQEATQPSLTVNNRSQIGTGIFTADRDRRREEQFAGA